MNYPCNAVPWIFLVLLLSGCAGGLNTLLSDFERDLKANTERLEQQLQEQATAADVARLENQADQDFLRDQLANRVWRQNEAVLSEIDILKSVKPPRRLRQKAAAIVDLKPIEAALGRYRGQLADLDERIENNAGRTTSALRKATNAAAGIARIVLPELRLPNLLEQHATGTARSGVVVALAFMIRALWIRRKA